MIFNEISSENAQLLLRMHLAFSSGKNVMEFARSHAAKEKNSPFATLVSYDLQAGSYIKHAQNNSKERQVWGDQIAKLIDEIMESNDTIMEVGVGESTTLTSVLQSIKKSPAKVVGFDFSWSRCRYGIEWLKRNNIDAEIFVANLFNIPLADNSIDIVYTSHSLEPNGGMEAEAIGELFRVARKAIILIEPIYELANSQAKARMESHCYIKNLFKFAQSFDCDIVRYELLNFSFNPLNPSGVIIMKKKGAVESSEIKWQCPFTKTELIKANSYFFTPKAGIAYPILDHIPILCSENAMIASALGRDICL